MNINPPFILLLTSIRVKHLANQFTAMGAKSACAGYRKSRFAEPTQVSFALVAAVLTAKILIPNSGSFSL